MSAPPMDVFPRSWSAQVLTGPPLIAPARQFVYPLRVPGEEDALNRGALLLSVRPSHRGTFLATCALGFRDPSLPTGVWACPSPDHMLALAGGYAYWINTVVPEKAELLEQRPTTAVLPSAAHKMVLLAGFHDVVALGPEGVLWRTARLSWEGVMLGEVNDGVLHGRGWDMFTDQELPFSVDLTNGTHEGGGYLVPGSSARSTE